jgi:serine/threonine protein phosphatase PrpC
MDRNRATIQEIKKEFSASSNSTGSVKSTFRITVCCDTDCGIIRMVNEDICLANNEDGYFLVADGLGNTVSGKLASQLFKEAVVERFSHNRKNSCKVTKNHIQDSFHNANAKILAHVKNKPNHSGMGCTAELLAFTESGFLLGHVGDSRTYRLRNGELTQLTRDHTVIQDHILKGLISPGSYKNHPMANSIIRMVGSVDKLEVDIFHGTVSAGDIYLLCSDGLSKMLNDTKIKEILTLNWPVAVRTTMLIDQANQAGGRDNITVLLIEVK